MDVKLQVLLRGDVDQEKPHARVKEGTVKNGGDEQQKAAPSEGTPEPAALGRVGGGRLLWFRHWGEGYQSLRMLQDARRLAAEKKTS